MEHIVQFAIGIDDEAIVKNVMKHAEDSIVKDLNDQIKKALFNIETSYYGAERNRGLQSWVEQKVDTFLEDHKDEIIKLAAERLSDKMSRNKTVKEAMVDAVKEQP